MQSNKPHLKANNNKGGKKADGKTKVIKSKKIEKIETNFKGFEMSILYNPAILLIAKYCIISLTISTDKSFGQHLLKNPLILDAIIEKVNNSLLVRNIVQKYPSYFSNKLSN